MNILICSIGPRVKQVEFLKEALSNEGKVIAGDSDPLSAALYVADDFVLLRPFSDEGYIASILTACREHDIDAIIPVRDEEVLKLVKNKSVLDNLGIKILTPSEEMVEICLDKMKTYQYIRNLNYPGVPTFSKTEEMLDILAEGYFDFPLIVKPANGDGSIGVCMVDNKEELERITSTNERLLIQPYLKNREFGCDVYVDLISGELVDMFIKEKKEMKEGATDKAVSLHHPELEKLVRNFLKDSPELRGPIDIDLFEYNGHYFISEINPRFGAGYIHAHLLGCNYMDYIVRNLKGQANTPAEPCHYENGVTMVRYYDYMLKRF